METKEILNEIFTTFDRVNQNHRAELHGQETGVLVYVNDGIARVQGLPGVKLDELVRFPGDRLGMAFNLDPDEVGVVLLDVGEDLKSGSTVQRTGRVLDVPVGEALLGRVVDATGRPLDNRGPVRAAERRPVERKAAAIMDRAPVTVPLQTGIKVVDAMIPVGRGQRQLIIGDRQTGKTAIALDTMINQKGKDVLCIYCAIGQRGTAVAKLVDDLHAYGAMEYSIVVVADGADPAGLQFITPYAATSIAEYFMEQGRDILIIYDDLTRHAQAYREMSLLMRRPPGREAFPGDIFYIHSRLLERSTHLNAKRGGGSLTALPIVETEAQNLAAYIPTNLISITDGQIYLSPVLFQKGVLPAVDVGKSVSRVGGKTQLPAYRSVAGDLRLSYAQFEELEAFSRFSMRLDEETRRTLEHGKRVREILKQPQYKPIPIPEQIAVLLAVTSGVFDDLPLEQIEGAAGKLRQALQDLPDLSRLMEAGEKLSAGHRSTLIDAAKNISNLMKEAGQNADS
ncbi:MAG: ATP F0F1 synthase subunit alpha [Peptococcaceae bacterium BRH_c4b]|nr:MAG: ATP F0F1 synthase subunit alpha [Peptococcaceae bacterium BRH_c4b]